MISLEQVRLLESKVSKAIEYVQKVTDENKALLSERANLVSKLDSNQKRLGELELLVMRFKEDQGRIEDGIMSALDRLSQFEEAFENSLTSASGKDKPAKQDSSAANSESSRAKKSASKSSESPAEKKDTQEEEKEFFEIEDEENDDDEDSKEGELDIF